VPRHGRRETDLEIITYVNLFEFLNNKPIRTAGLPHDIEVFQDLPVLKGDIEDPLTHLGSLRFGKIQSHGIRSCLLENALDLLFRPGRNLVDMFIEGVYS